MADFSQICIIGLGYIGLPTATIFANKGIDVLGVDTDPEIVTAVNAGQTAGFEPELDTLLKIATKNGKLRASSTPEPANVFIIAVPTPCDAQQAPNLTFLWAAVDSITPFLEASNLIVIESTIPIGATEDITRRLADARPDIKFPERKNSIAEINIAHSPERVLPGQILHEIATNDRVVGGMTSECAARTAKLYQLMTTGSLHQTNARTAEMVKLSENAFRDTNIAFANELKLVAEKLDIDIWTVLNLANQHPRVNILRPGPGVGGHCIPIDPWFIVNSAPKETHLIRAARAVNDSIPEKVVNNIIGMLPSVNATICCLGLAYKGNVNDLRESPAIIIVKKLLKLTKGPILIVEPYIRSLPPELVDQKRVSLIDLKTAIHQSNIIVLLTDHNEFAHLNNEVLEDKIKVDTRGIWQNPG